MSTAEIHEPTTSVSDWREVFSDDYWLQPRGVVVESERPKTLSGLNGRVNKLTAEVFDRGARKAIGGQIDYTELPVGSGLDLTGLPAGTLLLLDAETLTKQYGFALTKHQGEDTVELKTDYPAQILNALNSDPEELVHRATTKSEKRRDRGVYGPAEYVLGYTRTPPQIETTISEQYARSAWFGMVVYVNQEPRLVSYRFVGSEEPKSDCGHHPLDPMKYIHKHAAVGRTTLADHKEGASELNIFPLETQRLKSVRIFREPAEEWQAAYDKARGSLLGRFMVSEAYRQPQVVPVS